MDGCELGSLDGASLINGFASDVHDTTKRALTDWNPDGMTGVYDFVTTGKTFGTYYCQCVPKIKFGLLVPSIAIVRTTPSPKCCYQHCQSLFVSGVVLHFRTATSSTSLRPLLSVSRALRMEGSVSPSNLTICSSSAQFEKILSIFGA